MLKEKTPLRYPTDYQKSFEDKAEHAVDAFIRHLSPEVPVDEIQILTNDQGTIVYIAREGTLQQVNWHEPWKTPGDYLDQGYASTFWAFYGPTDAQIERAQILALKLGIPLNAKHKADGIVIPSLGMEIPRPASGLLARPTN